MAAQSNSQQSAAEIFGSDRMWGLKELDLPEPVSWWPQTPGWYVLAALLVVGVLLKIFGGAIADRLELARSPNCGPGG